jgi:hypothetical protein
MRASNAFAALDTVTDLRLTLAIPRLEAWLATDSRIKAHDDDIVRLDERFQARTREVLAGLS